MTIRVLLVDDHALVRAGVRMLLQRIDQLLVVAETGDGTQVLHLIERTQPDMIFLDISMDNMNGLEVLALIMEHYPAIKVIMLSMHANEEYVWQALRSGAVGYLLKDSSATELELAVQAVAQGENYLSPTVSTHVIRGYRQRVASTQETSAGLTERQREILKLMAGGRTTRDIANLLNISIKTVESHRMQMMKRLEIYDLASLVRHAIRIGLVNSTS